MHYRKVQNQTKKKVIFYFFLLWCIYFSLQKNLLIELDCSANSMEVYAKEVDFLVFLLYSINFRYVILYFENSGTCSHLYFHSNYCCGVGKGSEEEKIRKKEDLSK